jgi:uncharacterized OB-fold protein
MSKEKNNDQKKEEIIYFGEKNIICFACGQKINPETEICPYCGISQRNSIDSY